MPLLGTAFVIMWHDIAPEGDALYNLWHTREHMPERIALPGFRRARRGVNRGLDRQHYFTLYEGDDADTFLSEGYLRSLNHPTEWTQSAAPHFRNFIRMSCAVALSESAGVGGAFATFRLAPAALDEAGTVAALQALLPEVLALPSVTGAHVGYARPDYAGGHTREIDLRPRMDEPAFAAVLVLEGIGLAEVTADQPAVERLLAGAGLGPTIGQCYDMAYLLTPETAA